MSAYTYTETNSAFTSLGISTYAGITITGAVNATYQIQQRNNVYQQWQYLSNVTLPYSPYTWIDYSAKATGARYYRTMQLQ